MGEMLLASTLFGGLNPNLAFKNRSSSAHKRPAATATNLLKTENNILNEENIYKEKQCKQTVPEKQCEQPMPKKHKRQLLEECQIVLDLPFSMNIKDKQELRKKILDNGGTLSCVVTRKSNVVISIGHEANSLKQKMAKKYGVPVVMQSYIDKCIMEQQLLDTKEFLVSSGWKANGFDKGKIIADSASDSSLFVRPKSVPLASVTSHPYEGLHGYTLVKAILLKGRSFRKVGINKRFHFYVLELHSASGEIDINVNKQFCVYTDEGYLDNEQNGNIISRKEQCYYLETADDALSVFSQLYFSKSGQPHCMIEAKEILHPSLGTPEFQKLQLEWCATLIPVTKDILNLVDLVWMEGIGHLNQFLAISPENIPMWKIDEAEGILLQINIISSREKWEELAERLSVEFYAILPHKPEYTESIVTKKILSQKQDLCQILRDMVSVSETSGWSSDGHLQAKYRALHCYIEQLIPYTEEYGKIEQFLIQSQLHATGIEIQAIYNVHRYLEAAEFTHHLPNKQLLFHATSPSNLVGILSHGLNLPKVVVQERGIERFDIGMLGGGIYFTNALSTCIKYSRTSKERRTRFLLVSEVALGKVYETTVFNTSLTGPPDGFDSVHGVKGTESVVSDFMDDEFVIYTPCQQCMHYLVEFTLPQDQMKAYRVTFDESDSHISDQNIYTLDLKDTTEQPKTKPKAGLQGISASETIDMPLKEVHVRAQLVDLVAQVVVFQEYKNLKESPLECKYVFPLETSAAVCGFEAFINNKHVVGKIKRKEIAHKEYKEAISKGHGAYLMDEESPDVFTVSVGNIPPLATVIIKITYILELPVNDEMIAFNIPTSVAPWIEHQALHQVIQNVTDSLAVEGFCNFSIEISVEMPFPINTIFSPTHEILLKRTETTAVVRSNPQKDLSDGFTLLISLKEIHVPRMWTENHEYKESSQASMLVFYPEFEVKQSHSNEIIIVLDASNSMRGDSFQSALQTALLCLMEIPHDSYFNIVAFGTVFQELFPTSHVCNSDNIKKAKTFLKNIMPLLGNTELFHLLRYYQLTTGRIMKNVIIISDGHINNEGTVLRNAKLHCAKVRLFTCGISSTANKHMLCQLACWGGGAFEYMDPAGKSKWKYKAKTQIDRATQAALANVRIEWQSFTDNTDFLQAPQQIMSIFNGCRQVVYGFVPSCAMAKLVAVIDGKEYQTAVFSSNLNAPRGTMLHTLASRAVIRDWEDGLLAVDRANHLAERKLKEEQIVELSKEYSLVTSITSFIAVEERDEDEDDYDTLHLTDLLIDADVDILDYMEFETLEKGETRQYDSNVAERLGPDYIIVEGLGGRISAHSNETESESADDDFQIGLSASNLNETEGEFEENDIIAKSGRWLLSSMMPVTTPHKHQNNFESEREVAKAADSPKFAKKDPEIELRGGFLLMSPQIRTITPCSIEIRDSIPKAARKSAPSIGPIVAFEKCKDEISINKFGEDTVMSDFDRSIPFGFDEARTRCRAYKCEPRMPSLKNTSSHITPLSESNLLTYHHSYHGYNSLNSAYQTEESELEKEISSPTSNLFKEIKCLKKKSKVVEVCEDEIPSYCSSQSLIVDLNSFENQAEILGLQSGFIRKKKKRCSTKQHDFKRSGKLEHSLLSADLAESREYLWNVKNITSHLKDLLKNKGGLPLCNAVNRHIRDFAGKTNNCDMIKLMDGILKCHSTGLEAYQDLDIWSSIYPDPEKIEKFQTIMEKIAIDGYCEEDDCLKLDIITEKFTTKLEDAGLKSLGIKTALDIKRMLATLAVLFYFTSSLLAVVKEKISGQDEFQKIENLSKLLAFSLIEDFPATTSFLVALQFIRNTEQNHLLVYKSLDCGTNWEDFIIDYIKEPLATSTKLSWADIIDSPDVSMCYVATE